MHQNASSIVKWAGDHSDPFEVNQGVRQGGILSADLYKIHINPALERLKNSGVGCRIGDIFCGATACADNRTVGSKDPNCGQVLLSESEDFSTLERFDYQPVKSVTVTVQPSSSSTLNSTEPDFELNFTKLSEVKSVLLHI